MNATSNTPVRIWTPDHLQVPQTFPPPVEIADEVLTSEDAARLAAAEAKRQRKLSRKTQKLIKPCAQSKPC